MPWRFGPSWAEPVWWQAAQPWLTNSCAPSRTAGSRWASPGAGIESSQAMAAQAALKLPKIATSHWRK